MPDALLPTNLRRLAASLALGLLISVASHGPVRAQTVVVFVNGEPITAHDIDQRMKLIELSTRKPPPRQEALDELINEKLKLQVGKRYGLEIPDKDVEASFAVMARRANQTAKQFGESLSKAGISLPALKQRIKADITWNSLVRGKFPSINAVGEKDILSAIETRKENKDANTVSYQYTLRSVLFIVPHGSPPTVFEARKKDADALRTRFENCEQGIPFARSLTDVAVRDPIYKSSTDLGAAQREVLDTTVVGRLTPPEVTQHGVEMFAVCAKQPSHGDTIGKAQVREAMVTERYNAQAKRFLDQLRREAIIEQPH